MKSKIRILSEETINQIAAGEVVEHPASVVKELVENSLDAESKHITVEILAGGFQLIRIIDDGIGMTQDDALLSLERHATSKLRSIEDLMRVSSMGFRGEALASIASISKLTMITNASEQAENGTKVVVEGGKVKAVETCSRIRGTTLEIKSLFYTVPARKKFQKAPAQALSDIHKVLSSLALSRSDVHFQLISHDKELIGAKHVKMKERIEEVLGKEYAQKLVPIDYKENWIHIQGFIGEPAITRSNRMGQHLFINQRSVISPAVSYAVSDGYGTMLDMRKYPLFVLHFTLESALLDVNVHPQKKEVRFKDEGALKEVIRKAISLSLQTQEPSRVHNIQGIPSSTSLPFSSFDQKKLQDSKEFCFQDSKESFVVPVEPSTQLLPAPFLLPQVTDLSIIGIHRHYLFLEAEGAEEILRPPYLNPPYEGLLLVDLQAAAARIYFNAVMNSTDQMINMQSLLFPIKIEVTRFEACLLKEAIPLLHAVGIELRCFGDNVVLIEACASALDEEKMQEMIQAVFEELKTLSSCELERKKKLAIRTSKFMRHSKKYYQLEEAKKLLSDLLKTEHPYFCPLGKKTLAYLSMYDYKQLFI